MFLNNFFNLPNFVTKFQLPLIGTNVYLPIDFYMIMSRNDWYHHVVTQVVFLLVASTYL